ncbi:MAG: ABC transporter ATP-binding protein [Propionibacteriaceae bacterium]|jgi:ABC-2 type transport system ATP-binding protein|nr:ABC transporter ATP-binding protein [Propionibacteriaceae bacterium]
MTDTPAAEAERQASPVRPRGEPGPGAGPAADRPGAQPPRGTGAAIEVIGAVKRYGRARALDGFDLVVERGQVHGFLGPNGAGKSTTIRLLLGLIRGDGGTVRLLGGDPRRDAVRLHRRLAYVPGDVALWPNLTGGQAIDVITGLRGAAPAPRRDELIARFDLDPSKRCSAYSKGNRQKVALVAAFAADAELLLLDEPTSGLDPVMEEAFTACVAEAAGRGATVLLSSHILAEVEKVATDVTIIRDGQAVMTGTMPSLRRRARVTVEARTRSPLEWPGPRRGAGPGGADGQVTLTGDGRGLAAQVSAAELDGLMDALAAAGIESLTVRPASLEEIFFEHYQAPR